MKNIIGYPNIVLITCQVLVLLEIRLSEGVKCLSCRSADMKSCLKTKTTCGYNEQCYLEKVVDSQYTTTFNAGCRRKDACPRGPSLLNLIGRRELPVSNLKRGLWNWTVCSECCNTTNKALPCNADLCNQGCLSVKSDIVFLLDSSSSIGNNLFEHTLKTFAVDFISNPDMLVGPEYNQIGLVSFTGHEQKITSLNRYHDKTTMSQAVLNNFHFEAGSTETHEALRLVKNFIFTPLFGDRPDAENILVIITDGGSHFPPETLKEAKRLKDAGVRIYAIGVGDYNTLNHLSEINGVSSGIFATYGLYPYNPRAIQELLWKSICQNSTTRFGDNHWQHHTTKHSASTRRVTSRLTSPTVRTSVPTTHSTTPIPTTPTRISVPTAKTTTSVSVTPTRISVPTAKTKTSVSVTPTRISVPTLPVRISIPTAPNRVTVQTLSTRISIPTVPSRISVPTSQIRISVPTAKTQTPVVAVTQTFPISVPSQTNKPASPSPCLDHPFCIASGISICSGGYANWARGSCPNLCGFCKATTPSSPKPTTISSTRKPARLTTNTSQRTKTSLTTRKQTTITSIAPNKSQTSSFTGKQTKIRTTLSTTTQPRRSYTPQQTTISTQTSSKKMCRDNSNCSVYGPTICGRFVSFAKTHCSAYCGYCTPPLTTALPNSAKTNSPTTRTTTMTPLTTKAHTKSTKAILTTSTTKATTTSTTKAAMTSTTKSATTSTTTKSATTSTTTKSATTSTTTKAPTTSTTTKAATTSTTTKAPTTSTTTKAPTTSTTTKAPTTSTTTKASTISVTTKAPRPAATTKTSKAVVTTSPKPSTTAAATTKKLITGLSFDWKTIHIPG